jgi:putative glutamine amidotransferase
LGGTLWQDIPAQIPSDVAHRMEKPYHRASHQCILEDGSPLKKLCGADIIGVNSHHHQAVKDLAPCFKSMGSSEDGIIEALYDPSKPFLWAVQWHPERIWDIEESSAKLFESFLEASQK